MPISNITDLQKDVLVKIGNYLFNPYKIGYEHYKDYIFFATTNKKLKKILLDELVDEWLKQQCSRFKLKFDEPDNQVPVMITGFKRLEFFTKFTRVNEILTEIERYRDRYPNQLSPEEQELTKKCIAYVESLQNYANNPIFLHVLAEFSARQWEFDKAIEYCNAAYQAGNLNSIFLKVAVNIEKYKQSNIQDDENSLLKQIRPYISEGHFSLNWCLTFALDLPTCESFLDKLNKLEINWQLLLELDSATFQVLVKGNCGAFILKACQSTFETNNMLMSLNKEKERYGRGRGFSYYNSLKILCDANFTEDDVHLLEQFFSLLDESDLQHPLNLSLIQAMDYISRSQDPQNCLQEFFDLKKSSEFDGILSLKEFCEFFANSTFLKLKEMNFFGVFSANILLEMDRKLVNFISFNEKIRNFLVNDNDLNEFLSNFSFTRGKRGEVSHLKLIIDKVNDLKELINILNIFMELESKLYDTIIRAAIRYADRDVLNENELKIVEKVKGFIELLLYFLKKDSLNANKICEFNKQFQNFLIEYPEMLLNWLKRTNGTRIFDSFCTLMEYDYDEEDRGDRNKQALDCIYNLPELLNESMSYSAFQELFNTDIEVLRLLVSTERYKQIYEVLGIAVLTNLHALGKARSIDYLYTLCSDKLPKELFSKALATYQTTKNIKQLAASIINIIAELHNFFEKEELQSNKINEDATLALPAKFRRLI